MQERRKALASGEPELGWTLLLEVIRRCNEDDLSMIGAGALTSLLAEHPQS